MTHERRALRSENPWIAMTYLLAHRVPNGGALLSDDEGLALVATGLDAGEADRIAADVWQTEGPVLRTGAGRAVRMYTEALHENDAIALRRDVVRLLAAV